MCEVTAKRALLNYAIIQDIAFDVGQVIEDAILYNKDAKMNLGHPFLIYGLCKKAGVPLESNEAWIHPIKAIVVKKNKLGVPRLDKVYDSENEPLDEEELKAYQTLFGIERMTNKKPVNHLPNLHPHLMRRMTLVLLNPLRIKFKTSPCGSMHYGMKPRSIKSR